MMCRSAIERWGWRGARTVAALLAGIAAHGAQQSTVDGIYSTDQAARGRARYETTCQGCHAADASGGVGSALKGEKFISDWSGLPLARLFERIRTMPPNAPAPQAEDAAMELLAYVLAVNSFPAGEPLRADGVERIRFTPQRGPDGVPDFALVQVFGCIRRGAAGEWLVTAATSPARTKDPDSSSNDEQTRAAALAGSGTFRLLNAFPSPERFQAHLVEVKGFLIRGAVDGINVTALSTVAPTCP
jgi:mono/diheme cytochrome c family protein